MTRLWFKIPDGPVDEAERPLLAALKALGLSIHADYQIGSFRDSDEGRKLEIIFKTVVPDRDQVEMTRRLLWEP